ncbi:MAG: hypothetical protein QOE70_1523 [Chthoniobacter sp.]|jgi:hypothetical protein|nr:hypothetical protein [Chthoniobacter sp.]
MSDESKQTIPAIRRTKIVATLGPASEAPEVLRALSPPAWTSPG